jgi:hypothetical protein
VTPPVDGVKSALDFDFRTLKLTGDDGNSNPKDDEELSVLPHLRASKEAGVVWAAFTRADRVTRNPALLRGIVRDCAEGPSPMYIVCLETEATPWLRAQASRPDRAEAVRQVAAHLTGGVIEPTEELLRETDFFLNSLDPTRHPSSAETKVYNIPTVLTPNNIDRVCEGLGRHLAFLTTFRQQEHVGYHEAGVVAKAREEGQDC